MSTPDKAAELAAAEAVLADAIDHPDKPAPEKPAEDPKPAEDKPKDEPAPQPKPEPPKTPEGGSGAPPPVDVPPPAEADDLYPDFDDGDESDYDPALARALNAAKREIKALKTGATQFSAPQLEQVKTIVGEAVKAALASSKPSDSPNGQTVRPSDPQTVRPSRTSLARPDGARPGTLAPAPKERDPEADFAAEIDRKFFRS